MRGGSRKPRLAAPALALDLARHDVLTKTDRGTTAIGAAPRLPAKRSNCRQILVPKIKKPVEMDAMTRIQILTGSALFSVVSRNQDRSRARLEFVCATS